MSNQEMQFADPDWKPSQHLDTNNTRQEQEVYPPQPINNASREQNKWGSAPSSLPEQEGYTGLHPYAGPVPGQVQGGNYRQRPYSRRGRGPWFWIILAFIIFSLLSGGSRFSNSFGSGDGPGFDRSHFDQGQMKGKPIDYTVNGQATIVINDPHGNVTITQGPSNTDVSVQSLGGSNFTGNPNDFQQGISQNGNTITATIQDSEDLQVTVPEGANLNLTTDSGVITLLVPSSPAFYLDASTNSGSINSNFPNVTIQDNTSGSGQTVNGIVGTKTQNQLAKVVIRSQSGNIYLNPN
jgi:Putative adhesin